MAILHNGRIRVTTAAGVPISGGKLRIYNADTTTLATVYSNSGLSVALTNPVVADSDGWCPTIFAAEGTVVDIAHMTAAGVVLWTADDHVFLGASSSTLIRDFTNSRFQVRGSGGVIYMEAGNPTGDDTGGTMTIGGWNSSQLDALTVDSVATNFTGPVTVGSKKLPGLVTTATTTFTGVASVNIPLSVPLTGIAAWDVEVWDLSHATNATALKAALSFDGAGTFKTGAGDYRSGVISAGNAAVAYVGGVADGYVHITDTITVKSGVSGRLRASIIGPNATASLTQVLGDYATAYQADSSAALFQFTSSCTGSYGTPTHIQLFASSGNISGKYRVVGRFGHV